MPKKPSLKNQALIQSDFYFKNGKRRKHKKGTQQRVPAGWKKYTVPASREQIKDMMDIAARENKTQSQVFAEAMRDYIAKHWQ